MDYHTHPSNFDVSSLKSTIDSVSRHEGIQALPPEIISQIIAYSISPFDSPKLRYKRCPSQPDPSTLQICLISRLWYEIGWSTPELWTSVSIDLNDHHDKLLTKTIGVADRWLSRSGALPLSIGIQAKENALLGQEGWGTVLQWLTKYFERLHHLDMKVPMECLHAIATLQPQLCLPILSSLHMKCPQVTRAEDISIHIINSNQTLRDVSLTKFYLRFLSVPWQFLTHLRLRNFFNDEILAALSQTPNLMHLVIQTLLDGDDGHPFPKSAIILDRLETFNCISDMGSQWRGQPVFDALKLPNLRTFRIFSTEPTRIPLASIEYFLRFSNTNVQTLVVAGAEYEEEKLLDIWSKWPQMNVIALPGRREGSFKDHRHWLAESDVLELYRGGGDIGTRVSYFLPALELGRT